MATNEYAAVIKQCRNIILLSNTLRSYVDMQTQYSPELKLVMFVEKLQLALLAMEAFYRSLIDEALPDAAFATDDAIPPRVKSLMDSSIEQLKSSSDILVRELSTVVAQLCNGDGIVGRVNANIEKILYAPDTNPGKIMMENSRRDFEEKASSATIPAPRDAAREMIASTNLPTQATSATTSAGVEERPPPGERV